MRSRVVYHAVDSHTEGMPTRVITGGVGALPGDTMAQRRVRFMAERDDLRTLLMCEPRGHSSMSGAILQPPTRPDADWGVLYIEVSGCLPMCGHGTIGVATVLVETGMVEVTEPETVVRLDTPAGLVTARVAVDDGQATSVTLENIPSYVEALDAVVEVPGFGRVRYDLAYGGNFYAFVKLSELGLPFERSAKGKLLEAGLAIMDAINEQNPVPGWFDRSPCGTGTSARLAVQYARGTIGIGEEVINESFIGSRFGARVLGETSVAGRPAIRPSFTGRAWITGTAQYLLDPTDPFPAGFEL